MVRTLIEPYSDEYLQSWIITAFLHEHTHRTSPNLEQIQAGLRYFLNEQRKLGRTALFNDLPQAFEAFIESDTPTLPAYQAAIPAWCSFAQERFCHDAKDLESIYAYFEHPAPSVSHPINQRIYGALALWTACFIGTLIALSKDTVDHGILMGITLASMAMLGAYWHHISKDRVTAPVDAMKHAPLQTACEYKKATATSSTRGSWFWPVDYTDARKDLERHIGGSRAL